MPLPQPVYEEYVAFFVEYKNKLFDGLPVDKSELEKKYQHLLRLKKNHPGTSEVYNALGIAECVKNNKEDSMTYHKAAVTIDPSSPDFHYNYVISMLRFYYETKDPLCLNIAKKQNKEALKLAPLKISIQKQQIRILVAEEKINDAIEYIKELLKDKFPGNKELQELHEDLEDNDQFKLAHERAIDPNSEYIPLDRVISDIGLQS